MSTPRFTKLPVVKAAFSSHPGHGNAAKTVQTFQKEIAANAKLLPTQPADVQMERHDHIATTRGRG